MNSILIYKRFIKFAQCQRVRHDFRYPKVTYKALSVASSTLVQRIAASTVDIFSLSLSPLARVASEQ